MDLLWYRNALPHQRLDVMRVPTNVALVEGKQIACKSVCHVQSVIDKEHEKPVFKGKAELASSTYGAFSVRSR